MLSPWKEAPPTRELEPPPMLAPGETGWAPPAVPPGPEECGEEISPCWK